MHGFSFQIFSLTLPKTFVGEHFGVSENFGYRKILCFRWLCHNFRFSVEFFCLPVLKKLVGEPFCAVFQRTSGTENFMDKRGQYQKFPSKIFRLTVPKISVGEHFTVAIISAIEKVWIRGGSITIFRRSFCLTVPKYFIGEHFGVSEKFFHRKFSCRGGGASRFCRNFSLDRKKAFLYRNPSVFRNISGIEKIYG